MIQELLYTSAPKGLKPGSRGFCTVLSSAGMPAPVAVALEGLSGYRPLFTPDDPRYSQNPIVFSHLLFPINGKTQSVLSRIADYGLDYSQRTNKLAHHVVLDVAERPPAGPAWLLRQPGWMRDEWDGELRIVDGERPVPQGQQSPAICTAWQRVTGDAGWAGVLAEAFLKDPERPAYLIFSPGMDLLALISEALALIPPSRRWEVTFSTYFTKLPKGATCLWRCVVAGSAEANECRRYVQSVRINLSEPLGSATGGELVTLARTGRFPASYAAATDSAANFRQQHSETHSSVPASTDSARPALPPRKGAPPPPRPTHPSTTGTHPPPPYKRSSTLVFIAIALLLLLIGTGGTWAMLKLRNGPSRLKIDARVAADKQTAVTVTETAAPVTEVPAPPPETPEPAQTPPATPVAEQGQQTPSSGSAEKSAVAPSQTNNEGAPPAAATQSAAAESQKASVAHDKSFAAGQKKKEKPKLLFDIVHWDLKAESKDQSEVSLGGTSLATGTLLKIWVPIDQNSNLRAIKSSIEGKDIGAWSQFMNAEFRKRNSANQQQLTVKKSSNGLVWQSFERCVVECTSLESKPTKYVVLHPKPTLQTNTSAGSILTLKIEIQAPELPKKTVLKLEQLNIAFDELSLPFLKKPETFTTDGTSARFNASMKHRILPVVQHLIKNHPQLSRNTQFRDRKSDVISGTVKCEPSSSEPNKKSITLRVILDVTPIAKLINDFGEDEWLSKIYTNTQSSSVGLASLGKIIPADMSRDDRLRNTLDKGFENLTTTLASIQTRLETEKDQTIQSELKNKLDSLQQLQPLVAGLIEYVQFADELLSSIQNATVETLVITQEAQNGKEKQFMPFIVYVRDDAEQKGPGK